MKSDLFHSLTKVIVFALINEFFVSKKSSDFRMDKVRGISVVL